MQGPIARRLCIMKQELNNSWVDFLKNQENLLNQALQQCKRCQKALGECSDSEKDAAQNNYVVSDEQHARMEELNKQLINSLRAFESSINTITSAFKNFQNNLK